MCSRPRPIQRDGNGKPSKRATSVFGPYVDELSKRIAKFPSESINACKQAVYESIDKPIDEALKAEAYWLYQATSQTAALKRFAWADEQGAQFDMNNQRAWAELVVKVQEVN